MMDTPICVFDAQTSVDHIHEIKSWFYGGHLRLVVPISTSENVEQLYKKSIEPKPTAQEAPRPKSASKSARKVNPAFDINPAVVREFLTRLRKGKEEEQDDKEKSLCYEDERWAAIQFQTPKEEYTPWKDVPVEEPKEETPDDRPLSWAELAKKKLQANGSADKGQGLKGSAKPKLVSKASGHDPSPWKMQNNLPKVSASEVPAHLRPLMSCALWRLHESIDRNDLTQLFLLTDREEISIVAKKLNIIVRSCKELGQRIAASTEKVDLDLRGMLEKEGLVKPKEGTESMPTEESIRNKASKDTSFVSPPIVEDQVKVDGGADDEIGSSNLEGGATQMDSSKEHLSSEKPLEAMQDNKVLCDPSKDAAKAVIDPRELVQSLLKNPSLQALSQHTSEERKAEEVTREKQNAHNGKETVQFKPTASGSSNSDHSKSDPSPLIKQIAKSPDRSADPPAPIRQDEPDDSDEEVVVFVPNPKRMSAQKRGAASSSRPTTAHGHPVVAPKMNSPKGEVSRNPVSQRPAEDGSSNIQQGHPGRQRPRSSGPGLYDPEQGPTKSKAVPHGHPRPLSSGPTVIDPNAFGRGLPTNSTPGVLANVGASRRSRQHSPRTSIQGLNANASSASAQNTPQASPSRHKAARSPRRSPRAMPQKMEDSSPMPVPVISHQAFTRAPLVAPNAQSTQRSRFGPIGPPSKSSSNLEASAMPADADVVDKDQLLHQAPIQRPRSAGGPGNSHGHPAKSHRRQSPRSHPPNGSAPSPPAGQQPQRKIKKSLFEPEFDLTGALPAAEPEPKGAKMPEVQYTLKSGSTREAARGKGKLWTG